MSRLNRVFLLILLMVHVDVAEAQHAAITGVVVDARTGQALSGVLVTLEGQPVFTESDAEGRFTLDAPAGTYTLAISLVGYAFSRRQIVVGDAAMQPLRIELSEGAGAVEEHVTVAGSTRDDSDIAPAGATLHGRDLQALRGVTLDDPVRALHAVPSASATDDFYSEFAVRGLGFRHVGLVVDGVPTRYLMHSVHGVTDGGSIAMVNSDAVASVSLMPGSYPQRFGRRIGAQVDLTTREGDRERFRARAGLSGTSATVLAEGPLGGSRGSWLVSGRRSYLDLLLKRIDDENSLAFGFSDAQAKVVFDVTPQHHVQALVIAGASKFEEKPDGLGPNDEARVRGRSWLATFNWRYTPSAKLAITQRVFATGLAFDSVNSSGDSLDDSRSGDVGWRADATMAARPGWLVEVGADVQRITGRHAVRRSLNDALALTTIGNYKATARAASGYAQLVINPWSRLTLSPGARVDYWSAARSTSSPWSNLELQLTSTTRLRAGGGVYRQFADLEQLNGVRSGGRGLNPERATHVDVSVTQVLPLASTVQVAWFARDEHDVLWTPGAEPRLLPDGTVQLGRGDAQWANALDGTARGVEIVLRRDAPAGLSGWAGYAYNRHRYTEVATNESFWSDADQRHALSLFGHYRLSNRTTFGAKFRYGSNYPRAGYITERAPDPGAPPLFGGGIPLFYGLSESRNTLRLPAYARLDVRADRTFMWSGRRMTLFVEVANALNRRNVRNVPYGVDRAGRVIGGTDALMPLLPSAGLVIEF